MTQVASQTNSESIAAQILENDTPPQVETPEVQETKDEKISPKLQVLIKRERAAIERERAAKAKETELQSAFKERDEIKAKIAEFESLKKTNPMKALEMIGLSYQDLTNVALADGNVTPEIQIKQLREEWESERKTREMADKQREEDSVNQRKQKETEATAEFQKEISDYLTQNVVRYELIAFENAESLVYDVIDEHYERTKDQETGIGKILTIAEAADKVEKHLEQKYDKARSLTKVKTLLAPQPAKVDLADYKPKPKTSQMQKTLNNNLSATPSVPRTKFLSDEERIQKAIAYAKGLRT